MTNFETFEITYFKETT